MKSYSAQKEHHTGTSIKNVQNQKLHLAKNYLEQELEVQGHRGHVTYDQTRKALVQFRIKEGTVAVLQDGKLSIFKMPVKKFRGAYPLEVQSVDMELIKTQKATCCKKCKEWKKSANITRCSCGGYLVSRKRFAVDAIPSWDAEFLEIEFARKDIALAKKTDRVLAHKTKAYIPTGIITHKLAGKTSTDTVESHKEELLLIPKGDELKSVLVRPVESCSLIFVAAIDKHTSDVCRLDLLKKYELEPVDLVKDISAKKFTKESRTFINDVTPHISEELVNSWSSPVQKNNSR